MYMLQKETGKSEGVKSAENQFLVQAKGLVKKRYWKQAGAELCQAQLS